MRLMAVTLEVSKLSGWLNADADCRESEGGHKVRGELRASRREGGGRPRRQAACKGGRDCRLGAGHGEERTRNICNMFVTPEVSKLSGWLNALAFCRESKGGHTVRGEVRPWRRRTTAVQAVCKRGLDCGSGAGHREKRTTNMRLMVVTLEVSKLSGWLNAAASCRVQRNA